MTATTAERVRRARVALGLSQEELAARSGVSAGAVGEIERGRVPRPTTLAKLDAALHARHEETGEAHDAEEISRMVGLTTALGESPQALAALRRDLAERCETLDLAALDALRRIVIVLQR